MLIAKHTLRLTNFTFVVGLTKIFSQILDPIDLLLRFFFRFKKVKILLKWLYSSLFQLDLRLGCAHFYFKPQNRKNKIKNIIIIFFLFWGSIQGVHLNPLGSKWSRHWHQRFVTYNNSREKQIFLQLLKNMISLVNTCKNDITSIITYHINML